MFCVLDGVINRNSLLLAIDYRYVMVLTVVPDSVTTEYPTVDCDADATDIKGE